MSTDFRQPLQTIDREIVRAYDFRGRVATQLTAQTVYWLGRAYAHQLQGLNNARVCVGADGRNSSPELKQALVAGLREGGADVLDCGFCATPVVYFAAAQQQQAMNAVVLTASHNPSDQNGLKLILNNRALLDDEISELATLAGSNELHSGAGKLREQTQNASYVHAIAQRFELKPGMKVVVDCGNGIGGPVTEMLFKRLNTRLSLLFADVNGDFPNHSPDPCVASNLFELQRAVVKQKADIGFALDGDADRVVAVSASGRILVPDQLLMLLAGDILEQEPGLVLMDAKCSSLVRSQIESKGGAIQIGRTGHSPMKRLMQASGALCGGELSAHYYFADWYGFDDGLFTAVRLLELMQRKGQTLDQLIDALPQRLSTPEMRIEVADERKFEIVRLLENTEFNASELISIDGLRVEYPDGWGLVRASNTESALVVRFEANSQERINEIITIFNQNLAQIGADDCAIELFN